MNDAEIILRLEEALCEAMKGNDVKTLDALLSDDLIFTTHIGRIMTKADDLKEHKAKKLRLTSLDFTDQRIQTFNEVAVVTCLASLVGIYDGSPLAGEYRYTRVWKKAEDAWQVIVGHCSAGAYRWQ